MLVHKSVFTRNSDVTREFVTVTLCSICEIIENIQTLRGRREF